MGHKLRANLKSMKINNLFFSRTFTCNMRAFGLSKELCYEFLRKQATIANLKDGKHLTFGTYHLTFIFISVLWNRTCCIHLY